MRQNLVALAVLIACAFTTQAQDGGTSFKPAAGSITTEVLINDFANINLNNGMLRGRYFTNGALAFRLSMGANYNYDKISEDAYSRTSRITLAPGIEKHFAGTERLSPYIGAELPISLSGARFEGENIEIKGATSDSGSNRGYFSAGLNAVAGTDFYFAHNFYVGVEVGVGLRYRKDTEIEINGQFTDSSTEGFHSINFYPFVNGGIRVGFAF